MNRTRPNNSARGATPRARGLGGMLAGGWLSMWLWVWMGTMGASFAAQPFVKTIQPIGGVSEVTVQAVKVDEDGSLLVAGVFRGTARFSPTIEIAVGTQPKSAVFLARQDPSGGWAWAKTLMVSNTVLEYVVKDIAIAGVNVLVGGELTPISGTRSGWAALQSVTQPATAPVIGVYSGGTDSFAYASVSRVGMARDGALYVGGKFRKQVTDGTTTVAGITPVIPGAFDQDFFIIRLNAQLRIHWAVRGGSSTQDVDPTYGVRLNGQNEDLVGLEVDAEGTVLPVFNVAGIFFAAYNRPVFLRNADGSIHREIYTGYNAASGIGFAFGALCGMTGRISTNGTWQTIGALEFNLRLDHADHTPTLTWNKMASDAALADGKLFVTGFYRNNSSTNGFLIRTGADSVRPDGPVVYLKSLNSDVTEPQTVEARGGRVFLAGGMGRTLRHYLVDLADGSLGNVDLENTSIRTSQFVAGYDGSLNPSWSKSTTRPNDEGAPQVFSGRAMAYDSLRRVVYWGGGFRDSTRKLVLGEEENPILLGPAGAPTGWLAALEETGRYREQVRLQVNSLFGPISVNGSATATTVLETVFMRDTTVTVEVPAQFPAALSSSTTTRQRCTGFRIDGTVVSGDANRHTFVLGADTTMSFGWQTEHRLRIASDHATAGLSGTAAAGGAEPPIGDSWIRQGDLVTAFIDGLVRPVDVTQTGTRYIVTGYSSTGASGADILFSQVAARQQVPQFTMTGPASITYRWKQQHRVQISTTSEQVQSLPLARQLNAGGAEITRGTGSGEFWFDNGSQVQLLAPGEDTTLRRQLKGWRNADPLDGFFPRIEYIAPDDAVPDLTQVDDFLTPVTVSGRAYYGRTVTSFNRPARVSWDFGDLVYRVNTAIGDSIVIPSGVAVAAGKAPTALRIVDAPPGSTIADMQAWDDVADRAYPLRPGIYYADWDDGAGGRVVTQVFAGFPGEPIPQTSPAAVYPGRSHYRHIADTAPEQTPPVALDPATDDDRHFLDLKYQNGAALVVDRAFQATAPGKAVLLFSLASSANPVAVGDLTRETLQVRVVETRPWDAATDWTGAAGMVKGPASAVIGARLTSAFDTAGLGTGYLIHSNANYNADIHVRSLASGPIIPVNRRPASVRTPSDRELVVVWYERTEGIAWPYQPVRYTTFTWPAAATGPSPAADALKRIVIAGRLGSEGLDHAGNLQPRFVPARYERVKIYNQPDPNLPGYNPNEEHARIYPSILAGEDGITAPTAYALRDDLNITEALIAAQPTAFKAVDFTSDPYVLVQFYDTVAGAPGMAVYAVQREDPATRDPRLNTLPGAATDTYEFRYTLKAGELVAPPYPLNRVIGLTPCVNTVPALYSSAKAVPNGSWYEDVNPGQRTWFVDHKGQPWAVSGDSALLARYQYPLASDFWYPSDKDADPDLTTEGACISFLPAFDVPNGILGVFAADAFTRTRSAAVRFVTTWPDAVPVLKVGESLTYPGGEYKADQPDAPGLPGVVGWASGEVVFDSMNPSMSAVGVVNHISNFVARLISPLDERLVPLPTRDLPDTLKPGSPDVRVDGDRWFFTKLPPSLQKRIFFQPLAKLSASHPPGVLGLRGFVNDRTLGASDLTAAPPPVYVLEPNILTATERAQIIALAAGNSAWSTAVNGLADLSRNPTGVDADADRVPDTGWLAGLQPETVFDADGENPVPDPRRAVPLRAFGPGLALVTNPRLLDPRDPFSIGYVTLAENNDPSLGAAPVTLHVIKVDRAQRYRGAIKTVLPDNVFDEKITLRHTADFGGNVDAVAYAWWYREEDGTVRPGDVPPGAAPSPIWTAFSSTSGLAGQNQIDLQSNPTLLLADQLFFVRYRHVTDLPASTATWTEWAGAANSSPRDLNADGRPDLRPQLASGWVKRVLDAVNPYEARVREFSRAASPATASSMIQQLGGPYVGPVALNASKDVVENVGLIELYETVLARARGMSVDASSPTATSGINAAILLASTRLADFYTLLGNEAWQDALDPTLAFGNDTVEAGSLTGSRFCFENQLPTLLDEELALLRGTDESLGRPVFNRLFWNFTKAEGEVAYALNYQIRDVNGDGFLDESDAMRLYPQGHGDAWGHYLMAMNKRYELLRHPQFNWEARSEYYNLLDVVLSVDFADERKFAQTAATRALVGAEIVSQTYRQRYVENPDGQWQGYLDGDTQRAWGVTEWARRAGQAAYFDWLTANALLVPEDNDPSKRAIQRLDRKSVTAIAQVSAALGGIQITLDASNSGLNPLGLDPDVVPFDIDPTHLDVGSTAQIGRQPSQGSTHFEQIFERAFSALKNANEAFSYANAEKARLRKIADASDSLRREAVAQDLGFRNRLIEIFGTPYSGTVGPGKPYPPGYNGADLNLFMYVDVNAINSRTVPVPATSYFDEFVSFHSLTNDVPEEFRDEATTYFLKQDGENDITYDGNTTVELLDDGILRLHLPATAGDYTFVAPDSWGQRAAPGRLQAIVTEMMQVEADLSLAVGDYDFLYKQVRDRVEVLQVRSQVESDNLQLMDTQYKTFIGLTAAINSLRTTSAATLFAVNLAHDIKEAVVDALPLSVGTSTDPSFAARGAISSGSAAAQLAFRMLALATDQVANVTESSKELIEIRDGIKSTRKDFEPEIAGMLTEIEELLVNEGVIRIRIFGIREQLRGLAEQYRATLQEGLRILEERRNANTRLAALTQDLRYHDMTFRVARSEGMQKYRAAFDLAARYAYLAAKAYDFETNFDLNDRGSAMPLLNDIVRERALGEMTDTQPVLRGGLAGIMARLQDNFRAVEGRLGFNNLQLDTSSFSLRRECFRSDTDAAWVNRLAATRVADLWAVPEFRRFCRPFAARGDAQPGLVIRFGTEVKAGQNFFGKPLGPGDSSFDPSLYATKIRGSGLRFEGYPVDQLARTPTVYLVPVGFDRMLIPDSPTLQARTWNVVDQAIPVPYQTGFADLARPNWIPMADTLNGSFGAIRRFSSFRAGVVEGDPDLNATRLVGRSVWNTDWMIIIPGQGLHANPAQGLDQFLAHVTDIRLTLETYGYSGN